MTAPIEEPGTPPVETPPVVDAQWDSFIGMFPEAVRPLVETEARTFYDQISPKLQDSTKYEPFKDIIDQYDPKSIETALIYAQKLNEDPIAVFQMLQEKLPGLGYEIPGNAAPAPVDSPPIEDEFEKLLSEMGEDDASPALKKLIKTQYDQLRMQGELLENIGGVVTQREELTLAEQHQRNLQSMLAPLKEANPDTYDEDYILAKISVGRTAEEAMNELNSKFSGFTKQTETPSPAPIVIGAGNLPSNQKAVTSLTTEETNQLVAEYAKKAMQANQ